MLLYVHPQFAAHQMGSRHPETPRRLTAAYRALRAAGLIKHMSITEPPAATREQLLRVHSAAYLDWLETQVPEQGLTWLDEDTAMNAHTLQASALASGAAIDAVRQVLDGRDRRAFCLSRPPGHHAEPDRSMGFCFYNHVALAAREAQAMGIGRVAIVDFDVHHGNGTEAALKDDSEILLCSTFQHPWYPGTGADTNNVHIVNVPLSAGTNGDIYRQAFVEKIKPALSQFAPELILVSAGFDAHRADPLAMLNLIAEDYAWISQQLVEQADQSAQGRIVSVLEGGYSLPALSESLVAYLQLQIEDATALG